MSRAAVAREEFIEAVINGINTAAEDYEEYMRDDPLYGDAHYYLWENVNNLKDLHPYGDIKEAIDAALKKHLPAVVLEALKNCSEITVKGIYTANNSVNSWVIGEQEIQIDELNDIMDELTAYEKDYISRKVEAYWDPKRKFCADCVYIDMNYDVVYCVCDPDAFKEELEKLT